MKKTTICALITAIILAMQSAQAIPMPLGISGSILELDGITKVNEETSYSIKNINSGDEITGTIGRGQDKSRYTATIKGKYRDTIVITVWNSRHRSNRTIELMGVMRNVNLLINASSQDRLAFITSPLRYAVVNKTYEYDAGAASQRNEEITYTLIEGGENMTIDSKTGLLRWTPREEKEQKVIIEARQASDTAQQEWTITVTGEIESSITGITGTNQTTVQAIDSRPGQVASIDKRVYEYVEIKSNATNATINFRVEKTWLAHNNIEKENIVLNHYANGEWQALETLLTGEDEAYAYYSAKTPGFSLFAISVAKEERHANDKLDTYEVSRPTSTNIFSVRGTVHYKDRPLEAEVYITNLENGKKTEALTHGASYFAIVEGEAGDKIQFEVMEPLKLSQTTELAGDMIYDLEFESSMQNRLMIQAEHHKWWIAAGFLAIITIISCLRKRR